MSIPPTLLLADDSLTIQRVVSLTFADQRVRVVVAKDGQDAINRMAQDRPDLVLADTNMPCVDGYELARWVRQQPHLNTVPVLLLAGATDPVDEQRLHDSGANGVLEKPFEPSHVISRVKELLGLKTTPPATTARLLTPVPEAKPASPDAGVPAPDVKRKSSGSRPAAGAFSARPDPVPSLDTPSSRPIEDVPPTFSTPHVETPAFDGPATAHGDARDWFAAVDAAGPEEPGRPDDAFGFPGVRFYGHGDEAGSGPAEGATVAPVPSAQIPPPAPAAVVSAPADVFASLLAAETGDAKGPVVVRAGSAELTPEALDQIATRVSERLRPAVFSEELQRNLGSAVRQAVTDSVRDSVAAETRAAVAEAVQAAVNGTILGTIRGAVNEAIAAAVPAAVEQARASVEHAVREVVAHEIREIVHESADRQVREEIERIRARR